MIKTQKPKNLGAFFRQQYIVIVYEVPSVDTGHTVHMKELFTALNVCFFLSTA